MLLQGFGIFRSSFPRQVRLNSSSVDSRRNVMANKTPLPCPVRCHSALLCRALFSQIYVSGLVWDTLTFWVLFISSVQPVPAGLGGARRAPGGSRRPIHAYTLPLDVMHVPATALFSFPAPTHSFSYFCPSLFGLSPRLYICLHVLFSFSLLFLSFSLSPFCPPIHLSALLYSPAPTHPFPYFSPFLVGLLCFPGKRKLTHSIVSVRFIISLSVRLFTCLSLCVCSDAGLLNLFSFPAPTHCSLTSAVPR